MPVTCLRIAQVFEGISSERRIYESTLVGQTKLFSNVSRKFKRIKRFSEKFLAARASFARKFRSCWKTLPRFSGSTTCYPRGRVEGKGLLENRPCLREGSWIFSSETSTAFLPFFRFRRIKGCICEDLLVACFLPHLPCEIFGARPLSVYFSWFSLPSPGLN